MKKQLFMKAFKALVVLVLFVGAVSSVSAQQIVPREKALNMLQVKLDQIGGAPAIYLKKRTNQPGTPAQAVIALRPVFYKGVFGKIKAGSSVDTAIDAVYSAFQGRNLAAANTLRQEVIDYLTKSY